jgi:hypothetical protein
MGQPKNTASSAMGEPFAFASTSAMAEGAKAMSLFWSLPLRTMMVVMGEAVGGRRPRG